MAARILQAIAVPLLLAVSVAFFLVVAWASYRRRSQASEEFQRPNPPESDDNGASPPAPQSSNIKTVKK